MIISMIVAHGRNRVIGVDNVMPWHIPADLKFFKAKTLGKPVVMGRKTLQSIGRPLPGRPNIVVTRDESFAVEGTTRVSSLDEAIEVAKGKAAELGVEEIMIVGGGQIYEQMLARATRLYLTEIDLAPEGDAFFPDYRAQGSWSESWREHHEAEGDQPAFDFVVYERD
ncbi:type 3 dihydrofolate reductase [Kiloniella sp. b19]|uniref:type 3 dihydrofolate reductase n=1 Tax=Kiloniella sp. GXU_MW_B19 TaxID=3141326 RepID=UPI0031E1E516